MLIKLHRLCGNLDDRNFHTVTKAATADVERAIGICIKGLRNQSPNVRIGALSALAGLNHPRSRPALRRALSDVYPRVRCAAIGAIAMLQRRAGDGEYKGSFFFSHRRNLPVLRVLLRDPDLSVRLTAIAETSLAHGREFWEDIVALLDDPEPRVRVAALARIGDAFECPEDERALLPWLVEQCVHGLADTDAMVRAQAIDALAIPQNGEMADVIILSFDDPEDIVREAALEAVVTLVTPGDNCLTFATWTDRDTGRMRQRIDLHHKYAMEPHLLALLKRGVHDVSVLVRNAALRHIGFADDPEAAALLLAHAPEDGTVLEGLAGAGNDEAAIDALIAATEDPDAGTRHAAFVSLRRNHSPRAIPALRRGVRDKNRAVREIAARALVDTLLDVRDYGHFDYDDDQVMAPGISGELPYSDTSTLDVLLGLLGEEGDRRAIAIEALTGLTGLRYGDDVVRWATLGEALRAAQEAERQAMMARLEYGDEGGAGEVDA